MDLLSAVLEFLDTNGTIIISVIVTGIATGVGIRSALGLLFERLIETPDALAFWQKAVIRILPKSLRVFIHMITKDDPDAQG